MGTIYAWTTELRAAVEMANAARPALSPLLFCNRKGQGYIDEETGSDIRTVQELLGDADVSTTMNYTHVHNRGGRGVVSRVYDRRRVRKPPAAR